MHDSSRPTVALVADAFPAARALLEGTARLADASALGDATAIFCDSLSDRIDGALLDRAPHVRIVASSSVGYDNIDVDECSRRGIAVTNSHGALTECVADLVHLLVVASLRGFVRAVDWARSGRWMNAGPPPGTDVEGKTLGVVGFGAIGAALAARAQTAGMNVIYSNRTPRADDAATGARYVPFATLLATSDVVVALVPLTAHSRGMFGAPEFARMKQTAHFVNAGRGALVDTSALTAALHAGTIAAAALDVTDPEPLPPDHALYAMQSVIIAPHIGSLTPQTRERMSVLAARNIIASLRGEPLLTCVNPAGVPAT